MEITVVLSTSKPSTKPELVPLFVSACEGSTLDPKPKGLPIFPKVVGCFRQASQIVAAYLGA